jgi:uncharacterized membrane protein YdfJ with MMPL/SSD domain
MCSAVLADTFLVRILLVPAVVHLLGRRNWFFYFLIYNFITNIIIAIITVIVVIIIIIIMIRIIIMLLLLLLLQCYYHYMRSLNKSLRAGGPVEAHFRNLIYKVSF